MAHPIPAYQNPIFKKGDRVQNADSGVFGTVYQDQTDPLLVTLRWDKTPNVAETYKADAVRVAPWHGINIKEYVPMDAEDWRQIGFVLELHLAPPKQSGGDQYGGAVKDEPTFRAGDRVKLKYNRMCGTVVSQDEVNAVWVHWDKYPADEQAAVPVKDLVTLYAPRDTDPANPNQEAIDAIEVQRQVLIKEVDAVQARLRTLTTAKKLLERG